MHFCGRTDQTDSIKFQEIVQFAQYSVRILTITIISATLLQRKEKFYLLQLDRCKVRPDNQQHLWTFFAPITCFYVDAPISSFVNRVIVNTSCGLYYTHKILQLRSCHIEILAKMRLINEHSQNNTKIRLYTIMDLSRTWVIR